MKMFISFFIAFSLFWSNINANEERTVSELIKLIANISDLEMEYFFWVQNGDAYLARARENDSFGVWFYTNNRKWQPLHNAEEHEGFPGANKSFNSVSRNKAKETIAFTSIVDGVISGTALLKANVLANQTMNIAWYFWIQNGDAFLFNKENENSLRIWYYTSERKWQPIHNAGAFDGYAAAPKNLESASFDRAKGTLSTGKSIAVDESKEDENKKEPSPSIPSALSLLSSSIKDGEKLSEQYVLKSPELNWQVDANIKSQNIIKSYAISLQDMDTKQYHWLVINIPNSVSSFPEGAPVSHLGSTNLTNDVAPSYKGPFPPSGETHYYEFSIYAFSKESISGKEDLVRALYKSSIIVKYTGK